MIKSKNMNKQPNGINDFESKVKSMTGKEIVLAMVEALTHPPVVNINMSTFGSYDVTGKNYLFGLIKRRKYVCFGCAATNTICKISGKVFEGKEILVLRSRAEFVNCRPLFLAAFECAINELRKGDLLRYNYYAEGGYEEGMTFATLDPVDIQLPFLDDDYSNDDLEPYKKLAALQKDKVLKTA
jgi:hypothetical protein